MAYRRSISTRATFLLRQRFSPSVSYIHHDDDRKHKEDRSFTTLLQQRSFGSGIHTSPGFSNPFQGQRLSQLFVRPMCRPFYSRYMSTTVGEGADKVEYMAEVAEVLTDGTVEAVASVTPAVNEVAIAAADSAFPVAALQHIIDAVHSFTGLNWWASIALTTLLIRGATVPLLINQLKSTTRLSLLRPHLEEIKEEMQNRGMEPKAVAEGQQRMQALFKEYGVTPFTPLKGLLFQGPIFVSFFLAIENMVEKVPSFKHGGAYWFTDLTTPDSLYIFPALTALTFWITVETPAITSLSRLCIARARRASDESQTSIGTGSEHQNWKSVSPLHREVTLASASQVATSSALQLKPHSRSALVSASLSSLVSASRLGLLLPRSRSRLSSLHLVWDSSSITVALVSRLCISSGPGLTNKICQVWIGGCLMGWEVLRQLQAKIRKMWDGITELWSIQISLPMELNVTIAPKLPREAFLGLKNILLRLYECLVL